MSVPGIGADSSGKVKAATAGSGFIQTAGETDLNLIRITGPVTVNGGVLSGSGVIVGDLTLNGGYISPGHGAGLLAVTGNYTQGANGTLILERVALSRANSINCRLAALPASAANST